MAVKDITAVGAVDELCGAHQADLVTFSYSLSMIPKQVTVPLIVPLFVAVVGVGLALTHK